MMTPAASTEVYQTTVRNLPIYRIRPFDAYPNLQHAIFTRHGGISRAHYRSLNLSISVGDDRQAVDQNFETACQAVEITPDQTVSCHLIHSADVVTVTPANRQRVMGEADGMITGDPGIYLAMRFGDCTPLIFFDPVRQAIGLTHAGWRGTMKNAGGATVRHMITNLGCQPQNIIAVVGPAIGPCCYEVGPDVMQAAAQAFDEPEPLFSRRNGDPNRAHFDLWAANQQQLAAAGIEHIIQSKLCTACRTDEFFSHRAEKGRTGRFGVIIGLKGGRA